MIDVLAIFCSLPFLFLVGAAFAPRLVIISIGNKERFTRITWYCVSTFCLFPLYLFITVATTLWNKPIKDWPIDVVFQVIVAVLSLILIFNMRTLATSAYTAAFEREIIDDSFDKSKKTNAYKIENKEDNPTPSSASPRSSNQIDKPDPPTPTKPKRTQTKKR